MDMKLPLLAIVICLLVCGCLPRSWRGRSGEVGLGPGPEDVRAELNSCLEELMASSSGSSEYQTPEEMLSVPSNSITTIPIRDHLFDSRRRTGLQAPCGSFNQQDLFNRNGRNRWTTLEVIWPLDEQSRCGHAFAPLGGTYS